MDFSYNVQAILYAYVRMITVMYKYSQSECVTKETGLNDMNNSTSQVVYIHCKNVNANTHPCEQVKKCVRKKLYNLLEITLFFEQL